MEEKNSPVMMILTVPPLGDMLFTMFMVRILLVYMNNTDCV